MLPSPDVLSTSLHFSPEELTLFGGSNLYGATNDRRSAWQSEWEVCQHVIQAVNPEWGTQLTWSKYLTAATYISSRAFPSTLLSPNPSLKPSPTSHPVLLPGIDSLNHARAHPVSWVVNKPVSSSSSSHEIQDQDLLISLVLHQPTEGGSELFNNYGPKPNSELILGYGFSLPNNPDDTIVLKIGGYPPSHPNANRKWEVGRDASGIKEVWRAILEAVTTGGSEEDEDQECDSDDQDVHDPRDQLYATKLLSGMADGLLNRLPSEMVEQSSQAVQPGVQEMFQHYITGGFHQYLNRSNIDGPDFTQVRKIFWELSFNSRRCKKYDWSNLSRS